MANKYANLIGSKKINEDFKNINIGFDRVEQDMYEVDGKADQALQTAEGLQEQLDELVIEGDSSVEAAQARVSTPKDETFTTLKDRLDADESDLIAHKADVTQRGINIMHPPAPLVAAVGDGETNDTTAVQNIIDAAEEGSTIVIPNNGTFVVSGLTITKSLYFEGVGNGTIKFKDGLSENSFMFNVRKNGISIRFNNVNFDGNKDNLPYPNETNRHIFRIIQWIHSSNAVVAARSNISVTNCMFLNTPSAALFLQGYKDSSNNIAGKKFNINVSGCYFEKGFENAPNYLDTSVVMISGNTDAIIESSRFVKNELNSLYGLSAITITAQDTSVEVFSSITITNNYFEHYGRQSTAGLGGIGVVEFYSSGENVIIAGNRFKESYHSSIRGKTNSKNVLIQGNIIEGMYVDGNTTDRSYGIAINRGTSFGIYENYEVINNIISGVNGTAILLSGASKNFTPSGIIKNIIVKGNICDVIPLTGMNANGIHLTSFENAVVSNNLISGVGHGIMLHNCKLTATISHNQMKNISTAFIYNLSYVIDEDGFANYDANIIVHGNSLRTNIDSSFPTFRCVYSESMRNIIVTQNIVEIEGETAPQNFLRTGPNTLELVVVRDNILTGVAAALFFNIISGTLIQSGNYNATVVIP